MAVPRVLIADDQPEILSALSLICSAEGFSIATAQSPSIFLAKLGKEDFDLALIDMNYHERTQTGAEGIALLKKIREVDPSIPVVVMTAFGSIQLAVEALQL